MFHIIDDEEALGQLMVEILKSVGYCSVAFSNPVEYLNYVYNNDYASPIAIITDVRMPEMSGYELVDKVREKFPEQKFVIVSGYTEGVESSMKNISNYLSKPFIPEELIAIVDAIARCDVE